MPPSKTPTSSLPLPYLYSRATDRKGRTYYENHATETTTWLHPLKLAELQEAGFVAPSTSSAPFVEKKDYEPREDEDGKTGTRGLPLEALARGRAGREGAPLRKVAGGRVDGVVLAGEEEFTARGVMPPWVVEEVAVSVDGGRERDGEDSGDGGDGGPLVYWVDYRTDSQNSSQSPLDIYEARQYLKAQRMKKSEAETAERAEKAQVEKADERVGGREKLCRCL